MGGGGRKGGYPDPEIRGAALKKKFLHFGPQFDLKIRGEGSGPPGASTGSPTEDGIILRNRT